MPHGLLGCCIVVVKPRCALVEQFPPLIVISFLYRYTGWRVPDALAGRQIGVHMLLCPRLDDLHPLHSFGCHAGARPSRRSSATRARTPGPLARCLSRAPASLRCGGRSSSYQATRARPGRPAVAFVGTRASSAAMPSCSAIFRAPAHQPHTRTPTPCTYTRARVCMRRASSRSVAPAPR